MWKYIRATLVVITFCVWNGVQSSQADNSSQCPPVMGLGQTCTDQVSIPVNPQCPECVGGCAYFFKTENYSGVGCAPAGSNNQYKLAVCNREIPLLASGWNDNIKSYYVAVNTECIVTEHSNFAGNFALLPSCYSSSLPNISGYYAPGTTGTYPQQFSFNLKTASSIKCAQAGYFTQNNTPQGQGKAFEHAHFAGSVMNLSTGTNTAFVGNSWNDKISSVKIGPGIKCTFYNDRDFKGSTLTVGPNEVIYDLSSRGFNDKVSSIKCTACQ